MLAAVGAHALELIMHNGLDLLIGQQVLIRNMRCTRHAEFDNGK